MSCSTTRDFENLCALMQSSMYAKSSIVSPGRLCTYQQINMLLSDLLVVIWASFDRCLILIEQQIRECSENKILIHIQFEVLESFRFLLFSSLTTKMHSYFRVVCSDLVV